MQIKSITGRNGQSNLVETIGTTKTNNRYIFNHLYCTHSLKIDLLQQMYIKYENYIQYYRKRFYIYVVGIIILASSSILQVTNYYIPRPTIVQYPTIVRSTVLYFDFFFSSSKVCTVEGGRECGCLLLSKFVGEGSSLILLTVLYPLFCLTRPFFHQSSFIRGKRSYQSRQTGMK